MTVARSRHASVLTRRPTRIAPIADGAWRRAPWCRNTPVASGLLGQMTQQDLGGNGGVHDDLPVVCSGLLPADRAGRGEGERAGGPAGSGRQAGPREGDDGGSGASCRQRVVRAETLDRSRRAQRGDAYGCLYGVVHDVILALRDVIVKRFDVIVKRSSQSRVSSTRDGPGDAECQAGRGGVGRAERWGGLVGRRATVRWT